MTGAYYFVAMGEALKVKPDILHKRPPARKG